MTEKSIGRVDSIIAAMEDRTGDLPDELANVITWVGYIDGQGAAELLAHNIKPEIGKAGTNRRIIADAIPALVQDILGGNWVFNHQGLAFDEDGHLTDGQHRLEAIVKADKIEPGITVPLMITWNLPRESNTKVDLVRRRSTATLLGMMGMASSGRLNTALRLLHLYDNADFDELYSASHWGTIPSWDEIKKTLEEHPLVEEGVRVGGQIQTLITPSAAAAGWVICSERYPAELNAEFVAGLKSGAMLPKGDPRLALREWAANRKMLGKRTDPSHHLAIYLKAFRAFAEGSQILRSIAFKPNGERFPRIVRPS